MQEIKYKGLWWLPSDSENKVAGDLTFSNSNGIELNIIGSLDLSMLNEGQSKTIEIILGISEAGELITIYDSDINDFKLASFPGIYTQKYISQILFIGAHFPDPNDILFYKAEVDYSYLSDWANLSVPMPAIKSREYNFSYTCPENISAKIEQGQISVVYRYSSVGDLRHVEFRPSAYLQIEPKMELSFEDFKSQFIYPIKNFLTLATNIPNSLTSVYLYSRNGTRISSRAVDKIPIQAIFQTKLRENIGKKSILSEAMLFSLEDIKSYFSLVMQKWFNVVSKLDSLCNLFFSVQYSNEMYAEHRFLNLVQAAELYHRRKKNNQVLSNNEHTDRLYSILNSIPEEHKEWLKQKLEFSNEPTLKERLADLSDLTKEVIIPLIDDREKWIAKIKNTRNYYTHYNQSLEKKAAKGKELFGLTQKLSFVLQTCLLIELGCSPERSAELVQKNKHWKYLKENSQ